MNVLSREKQTHIPAALIEGNSIRATARMIGVEHKTVMRVLLRTGDRCGQILNERMRRLSCRIVQVDEIWTYVKKHEKFLNPDDPREAGDQYVFVAMDSESKIVLCFLVGKRNATTAWYFIRDLGARLEYRVQLTTDGYRPYVNAIEDTFGLDIDYAMLVKRYTNDGGADTRYSPGQIVEAPPIPITGNPNMRLISTPHIERQNLTMRMQMRRFTRLTNAFSKKLDNLKAACALYFAWYNFCRVHQTLRVTPAMQAGVENDVWTLDKLLS